MATPQDYIQKISEIVGDDITDGRIQTKMSWTNRAEGKEALQRIRRMQSELRQLNRDVSASASQIRSEYTSRKVSIGTSFGEGLAMGFLGRRRMGKVNAMRRDSLREQQLARLKPYGAVRRLITEVVSRLEEQKATIENSPEYQVRSTPLRDRSGPFSAQEASYLVRIGSAIRGPFSAEQVRGLLVAGVISPDAEMQIEGVEAWVPLRAVKAVDVERLSV